MNVADRLAEIKNRLAALEARAETRRARDAELAADVGHAPKAPGKPGRKKAEDEPAMAGRDWLSEARADLTRVDAAPLTFTRRERPSVAPEYASSVGTLQPETTENRTEPGTQPGGNADGAAAGNPESLRDGSPQPAAVPAAPEALNSEAANNALPASGAATHGPRKMPQTRVEHWSVRMARIDANVLRASFAPSAPICGPFDGLAPIRDDPRPAAVAGCGPPGVIWCSA